MLYIVVDNIGVLLHHIKYFSFFKFNNTKVQMARDMGEKTVDLYGLQPF